MPCKIHGSTSLVSAGPTFSPLANVLANPAFEAIAPSAGHRGDQKGRRNIPLLSDQAGLAATAAAERLTEATIIPAMI
jgi:hypothetical protein